MTQCWVTMESPSMPGHTHLCESEHTEGDHVCSDCGRWFHP